MSSSASNSSILLIYTGGTIGMMEDPATGSLIPFDFAHLNQQMPELQRFSFSLDIVSLQEPIDSSEVTISTWQEIADIIEKNYQKFDGFVVLHGTDTMAYSASALSFMLENLTKPVIFTGSQLPIGKLRTDGKENLITSIEIAAAKKDGQPMIQEVAVYFESHLFRGNRTHKYNTEDFDAFESANYPALANIGIHIFYNHQFLLRPNTNGFHIRKNLEHNVGILKVFPGISPAITKGILEAEGLRGLILESFGSGNVSRETWFIELLQSAIQRGIHIINVTQCNKGFVEQGRYKTSTALSQIGVISGADMTTEAALTKLMYLLGQDLSRNDVEKYMMLPLRGELTASSQLY